ncbi:hypothetical protein AWB81_06426 [Caballeronia arationis]|nr:hypothetical protein AWB81_06426 [Caballeronia arationis]
MFASLAKFAFDAAQENAENIDTGNTTTTPNQDSSTIFTEDNVKYAAIGLGAAAVVAGAAYWYANRDKAEAPKSDAMATEGKTDDGKKDEAKPADAKAAPEATAKSDDPEARKKQAEEDLKKSIAAAQELLNKGNSGEAKAA